MRELVPNLRITTDIIVAFPGETQEDFLDTLDVVEQVKFDQIFNFKYSPRPGTEALNLKDKELPDEIGSQRLIDLIELHKRYLDSINVSDESKNNIRTRIYDMLMDKYQLGKYENSKFIDIQDESQSEFIKTLKIIDNSLNGEIDIFDDHIVLKLLNNDEKTTSSTYEKISENKYFHKNKGEILISKLSIIRKDLQGNQDVLKYIELDSKIYNINTFHDPEALSKVLHNFSNNEKLRYTNHPWPDSLTYEKFYNDLTNGWKEIQNDIKSLSPTLHHYISMFLFWNLENEIIGFSPLCNFSLIKSIEKPIISFSKFPNRNIEI
jgi:hypothetical protein